MESEIGPRPSPQHSIDRVDPNGNYEPGNIQWATALEQKHNQRRKFRLLTGEDVQAIQQRYALRYVGEYVTQQQLADEYGVSQHEISRVVNRKGRHARSGD